MGLVNPLEASIVAIPYAKRALELDPGNARLRCGAATSLFWHDWEYVQAMEEMDRCLEMDPNDARSRAFYGHMLMIMGRPDEALEQGEQAVELDRRDPFVIGLYGTILASAGPPEEAIRVLETMFEEFPGAGFGNDPLGHAYSRIGLMDEATRAYRAEFVIEGDEEVVVAMDSGMEAGGSREARRRAAVVLANRFEEAEVFVEALDIAILYRDAGEVEKALDWLELSLEQHDPNLPYIGLTGWEQLYDHPRFQAVAEEIGVPLLGG
jgi:tetratricopeptide (TPR) repeat protein